MTNQKGDREFYQLTGDEKAIVTGIACRNICMEEIKKLTNEPNMAVEMRIRDKTIEAVKQMSPYEIERTIRAVRKSDE